MLPRNLLVAAGLVTVALTGLTYGQIRQGPASLDDVVLGYLAAANASVRAA